MVKAIATIDAEIIVVDNNSSDGSVAMVKKYFPEVKLIENPNNDGFSKGNNIGVAQAKGEYVCILNPDTVLGESTFEKLFNAIALKNNLGILGCRLIDGSGKFLPESKRNIPRVWVALKKMLGLSKAYYVSNLDERGTADVDIFVGAFMMIPRAVYNELNGFDEDYFMYGEDVDLSYRVLKKGYANWYHGSEALVHFKGESTLKDKAYAERFYGAMQLFYKKHFKQYWFFDRLVILAIKFAKKTHDEVATISSNKNTYTLLSNKEYPALKALLKDNVYSTPNLTVALPSSEIIFDTNYLQFHEMIYFMAENKTNYTYKFLLPERKVLLGSNDSKTQGEVVHY